MVVRVLLIILIILVIAIVALYIFGRRLQKKQNYQQEQMEAAKQTVSMLVIDKKRIAIKDSGLPQMVIDQTPKLMRRSKLPIVKAKVGPRIVTLVSDAAIFEQIPVKREIKAVISGIYIMEIKSVRGGKVEKPEKKLGFFARMKAKITGKAGAGKDSKEAADSKDAKKQKNK